MPGFHANMTRVVRRRRLFAKRFDMKHLLLEIVEATEAAALAASRYVGSGDKLQIDKVATEAMRNRLNMIDMYATVVIGEGKKDDSVGLFEGETVGRQKE